MRQQAGYGGEVRQACGEDKDTQGKEKEREIHIQEVEEEDRNGEVRGNGAVKGEGCEKDSLRQSFLFMEGF